MKMDVKFKVIFVMITNGLVLAALLWGRTPKIHDGQEPQAPQEQQDQFSIEL